MNDAGVPEAMLVMLCLLDRLIDVPASHEWQKGHHLLDRDERVMLIRFSKHEFGTGRHLASGKLCEPCGILPEAFLGRSIVVIFTHLNHCRGGKAIDFLTVESRGPRSLHRIHEGIKDRVDNKDFFFSDTKEVVVVRGALNDRLGGSLEVGRFDSRGM